MFREKSFVDIFLLILHICEIVGIVQLGSQSSLPGPKKLSTVRNCKYFNFILHHELALAVLCNESQIKEFGVLLCSIRKETLNK